MIFVYDNYYRTWYEQRNDKYYNYWGIPVSSVSSQLSAQMEFANWRELYCCEHFNPMEVNLINNKIWVSPYGEVFEGDANKVSPQEIVYLVFRIHVDDPTTYLENFGWLYLSTDEWDQAFNGYSIRHITKDQDYILTDWCDVHGLQYPDGVEIIF